MMSNQKPSTEASQLQNLFILSAGLAVAAKRFFVLSLELAHPPIQKARIYTDRPRNLRRGLTTVDNAAYRLDLKLTREFPPLVCHGTPSFPASP